MPEHDDIERCGENAAVCRNLAITAKSQSGREALLEIADDYAKPVSTTPPAGETAS